VNEFTIQDFQDAIEALQGDNLWTRVPGASLITPPDVRPSADRVVAAIAHARAQS
jgi:hypothetical protein